MLKQGASTLTIAGACSHDCSTTLSGGKVKLNGSIYYYVVSAVNPFGESTESSEVSATAHPPSTINKANNSTVLNLASSWIGSVLPNSPDTARWAGLAGANNFALGANTSLSGLIIEATGGTVSTAATLAGSGSSSSSGTVNIASGGALAPAGTFTINGALLLNNGSTLTMKLATPSSTSSKFALGSS